MCDFAFRCMFRFYGGVCGGWFDSARRVALVTGIASGFLFATFGEDVALDGCFKACCVRLSLRGGWD